MLNKLKNLTHDQFIRNAAILASGTIISQVIVLATLPIITRLYDPHDYGTYSVYISIIGILLMLVSFSYESSITLPKHDRSALVNVSLSLRILIAVSLVSGLAIYVLKERLAIWLHESDLPHPSIFVIGLLAAGGYQILNWWPVRKKYFKALAIAKCTQSVGQVTSQLSLSLAHLGALGLVFGELIGRFAGFIQQWRLWRSDVRKQQFKPEWSELRENAYRYRRFPFLSLPSNLLNSLGLYLPPILFAFFYGPHVAGWFALGQRLLGSPMTLISSSVSNVYLSDTSEYLNHDPSKLYGLFLKTARNVFFIGLIVILAFVLIPKATFGFIFGDEWSHSGDFIRILAVMYLSQFVANSVGTTIDVMERQDLHLYREIARTVIIVGSLLLARYTNQTAVMAVVFYSVASTIGYMIHFGLSWVSVLKYKNMVREESIAKEG